MENEKNCPHCAISDETIKSLKESAGQNSANKKDEYQLKKEQKERERVNQIRWRKIKKIVFIAGPVLLIVSGLILAFANYKPGNSADQGKKITVYLSPTCGCCGEYVDYLRRAGFKVEEKKTDNMLAIKEKYNITGDMESCHTAIIGDYFVEGHVPIEAINKLLEEKPNIDGIALPGMLPGSPGMTGPKRGEYKVYSISNGNSSEFYISK